MLSFFVGDFFVGKVGRGKLKGFPSWCVVVIVDKILENIPNGVVVVVGTGDWDELETSSTASKFLLTPQSSAIVLSTSDTLATIFDLLKISICESSFNNVLPLVDRFSVFNFNGEVNDVVGVDVVFFVSFVCVPQDWDDVWLFAQSIVKDRWKFI